MSTCLGQLRRRVLGLSLEETSYLRRGFRGANPAMRRRLQQVGEAFLGGYHKALECGQAAGIEAHLAGLEPELSGFACEGVAMGLALLDQLAPWSSSRVARLLAGAGRPHAYLVHVGVGWVWARLPAGRERMRRRLDPLLSWLAFDGWGFHEGFFHWRDYIHAEPPPWRLRGYETRAFDQGLGRSFWFVNGGNRELIVRTLEEFPLERRADLWSGIGLAAVYAGDSSDSELLALRKSAGNYWPALAQGAAFAAKARQRAGNSSTYTESAVRTLTGFSANDAARLTDLALENLPADGAVPGYEIWRQRIQRQFATSEKMPKDKTSLNATVTPAPLVSSIVADGDKMPGL